MCHVSAGMQGSQMNTHCGCECSCPVVLPIEDEVRILEDHKKFLQDRMEAIDKKIAVLKSVKEP
jgi:hypothetical protein